VGSGPGSSTSRGARVVVRVVTSPPSSTVD
jgi:hypothetical protein